MLIPLDLERLTADQGPARVSVFLPTVRGRDGAAENRLRLENLLRLVDDRLRAEGLVVEADALISAIRRAVDGWWRWRNPSDGLAVFADPGHVRYFRVPLPLPELATIGRRFLVGPLLPLLAAQQHIFVLSIDPEDVRLFTATRLRLDEVSLDSSSLPELAAARRERTPVHAFVGDLAGIRTDVVSHGTGSVAEDRQEPVVQLFRRVDSAVREALADECAPLVLAGVPSQQALYRKVNNYPNLLPDGVEGNPRDMPLDLLHSWAFRIAEAELHADECAAAGRYRALRGTGRTSTRPEEVLAAAEQGRVDTLFLSTDTWRPEASGQPSLVHCGASPSVREQLDAAALATLHRGGTVLTVPAVQMPDAATSGVAVFRS